MTDWLLNGDYGTAPTNYISLVISVLLAFACGHVIAWTYMFTHLGLSYSRSYVNTLIIMPVIVCLVMMILANNLVLVFGLMAIFGMVRYRSTLRDTLDTAYVLAVIVVGLACGTLKFSTAIIGCLATASIMIYLRVTRFGTRHSYDLILNVQWARPVAELPELLRLLQRHTLAVQCVSQRSAEGLNGMDLSYRLRLRDPARSHEMVEELRACHGVARVTSLQAQDESEL